MPHLSPSPGTYAWNMFLLIVIKNYNLSKKLLKYDMVHNKKYYIALVTNINSNKQINTYILLLNRLFYSFSQKYKMYSYLKY